MLPVLLWFLLMASMFLIITHVAKIITTVNLNNVVVFLHWRPSSFKSKLQKFWQLFIIENLPHFRNARNAHWWPHFKDITTEPWKQICYSVALLRTIWMMIYLRYALVFFQCQLQFAKYYCWLSTPPPRDQMIHFALYTRPVLAARCPTFYKKSLFI